MYSHLEEQILEEFFEMYFNASSRNAKEIILHEYHSKGLESAFEMFVDYISHFDTGIKCGCKTCI